MNRESAYEILSRRAVPDDAPVVRPRPSEERTERPAPSEREPRERRDETSDDSRSSGVGRQVGEVLWGTKRRQGMVEALAKQAARTVGSEIGRQILRGVLGGILGGSRRR